MIQFLVYGIIFHCDRARESKQFEIDSLQMNKIKVRMRLHDMSDHSHSLAFLHRSQLFKIVYQPMIYQVKFHLQLSE